jgi:hypothetical protein
MSKTPEVGKVALHWTYTSVGVSLNPKKLRDKVVEIQKNRLKKS